MIRKVVAAIGGILLAIAPVGTVGAQAEQYGYVSDDNVILFGQIETGVPATAIFSEELVMQTMQGIEVLRDIEPVEVVFANADAVFAFEAEIQDDNGNWYPALMIHIASDNYIYVVLSIVPDEAVLFDLIDDTLEDHMIQPAPRGYDRTPLDMRQEPQPIKDLPEGEWI